MSFLSIIICVVAVLIVISWASRKFLDFRKKAKGWTNVVVDDEVHTMPVNDQIPHALHDYCFCNPKTEPVKRDDGSMGWLVIHNAKDGRD